jgi:Helicase conserved C-terminal domain
VSGVRVDGTRAVVRFDRFDLDSYRLFLRAKGLPESQVEYDEPAGAYVVSTDARFAPLLDETLAAAVREELPLAGHLWDFQEFIVGQALAARRYACWADTGLGKTAIFLEWARQVRDGTGRRVLIWSPDALVIEQTRAEEEEFYGERSLERIGSRAELAAWCERAGPAIGITNYEKLIPGVMPELRRLGGIVADESSILKTGGGTIKWNLIKSARGVEFKLSCTATPAPNEPMEYASQAAFLEKLRSEGEILWTFFQRDARGVWSVKPHAREAFYRFMASWSIYMRDPARFGFRDILASLPDPVMHEHRIEMTEAQRAAADELRAYAGRGLFDERIGVRERSKLAQIARGFMYEACGPGRAARRIASLKPREVAEIVLDEAHDHGRPTIVWTSFDEESAIIEESLAMVGRDFRDYRALARGRVGTLHGAHPDDERAETVGAFRSGRIDVLVTKPSLVGYGLNFQHCRAMVFSGIDDSFERMYQAIRRAYRYGQTEPVQVHVPVIPELEGLMLQNLHRKQAQFDADTAEQERWYRAALTPHLPLAKEAA